MLAFLDVDGVLNSIDHFKFRGTKAGKLRRQLIVAEHANSTGLELIQLDEKLVGKLQTFAIETGCKFVITSTWRESNTPKHFEELFKLCGFPFPENSVIGCTPILDNIEEQKRGHEIKQWIMDNNYQGKYVVIDDDCPTLFLDEQPLINTNNQVGLTDFDVQQINAYFSEAVLK